MGKKIFTSTAILFYGSTLLPFSIVNQKDYGNILRRSGQRLARIDPVGTAHRPKDSKSDAAAPSASVQKRRSMGLHV